MNSLTYITTTIAQSLSWALLHSLWQGVLIYGLLFVILKALPGVSSRVKYYLSSSAFISLFIWFVSTWVSQYQRLISNPLPGLRTIGQTQRSADLAKQVSDASLRELTITDRLMSYPAQYANPIIYCYLAGLAFMLLRLGLNLIQAGNLKKQGVIMHDKRWDDFIDNWQAKFGIDRNVMLKLSDRVNVPTMLGALKPLILLPVAIINNLSNEQVEAILLHELAHIKRHDYLFNIVQSAIETLLFFNPFVWLISRQIRTFREECCDDMVVANLQDPLPYAKALALLETNRTNEQTLALAATGNKNQLLNRIKRIMNMKKKNLNYSQLTIIIVAFIAFAFALGMITFTPSFAQKAKTKKGDTVIKKSVYKYKRITINSNGDDVVEEMESDKPMDMEDGDKTSGKIKKVIIFDTVINSTGVGNFSYSYSIDDGDFAKVMADVTAATKTAISSLAKVDLNKIEKELRDATGAININDLYELKTEIDKAITDLDKEMSSKEDKMETNKSTRKTLEATRESLKILLQKIPSPRVETTISTSTDEDKTATEDKNFKEMLDEMEQDGLIKKDADYSINKENNSLTINGQKQPMSVLDKYKKYLDNKRIEVRGNKGQRTVTIIGN